METNLQSEPRKRVLLTGASGLLGHYMMPLLKQWHTITLDNSDETDIKCDPETEIPLFKGDFAAGFDLVIHACDTYENSRAMSVNLETTRNLLRGLKPVPVKEFIFLSSTEVYGKKEGQDINEDDHLWSSNKIGQSKALAEEEVRKFCEEKGVKYTILRVPVMFGKDMGGIGERMAEQVLNGTYFNIRDFDVKTSIVTAYDVARVAMELAPIGGIYNVTDGREHTMQELAMAMGNNRGKAKKPLFLPLKWAKLLARIGDAFSPIGRILNRAELERRTSSLTFSSQRLREALPDFKFHDTVAVIGRTDKDFPYEDL